MFDVHKRRSERIYFGIGLLVGRFKKEFGKFKSEIYYFMVFYIIFTLFYLSLLCLLWP